MRRRPAALPGRPQQQWALRVTCAGAAVDQSHHNHYAIVVGLPVNRPSYAEITFPAGHHHGHWQ